MQLSALAFRWARNGEPLPGRKRNECQAGTVLETNPEGRFLMLAKWVRRKAA
jgi:hypothetical protein